MLAVSINAIITLEEKILTLSGDLWHLMPEVLLASSLLALFLVDLFTKENKSVSFAPYVAAMLILLLVNVGLSWNLPQEKISLFNGVLLLDRWGLFFKALFLLGGVFTTVLLTQKKAYRDALNKNGELFVILFGLLLGVSLMVMAVNLLMIYLSIELVSICSYILTGIFSGRKKAEGH